MEGLDEGETSAIALATSPGADLLLMDDRKAVIVARAKGLRVTGTLGVPDIGAQRGLVNFARVARALPARAELLGLSNTDTLAALVGQGGSPQFPRSRLGGRVHFLITPFLLPVALRFALTWYKSGVQTKTVLPFFAVILFAGTSVQAFAQTQSEMNAEACNKLKKADAELNLIYQQVLAEKATDADFVKAFREAQRAWISFRDAHVRSIFPNPDPGAYGSVHTMCRCGVLEQITTRRANELQQLWIDGLDEGDVCTGSCAVKRPKSRPNRKE